MNLSIIIPTYNSGKTIRKTLDSIVNQTYNDWEVIIVDNVSTDNTQEIVDSYKDERLKIYSEADKGIYDAMNKGIQFSMGTWLYFLGSDDWLYNNEVLESIFATENNTYDVIYGDVQSETLDERHKGPWTVEMVEWNRCHQAIFYRKTLFEQIGLYNQKYTILADYDFNLKCFFKKRYTTNYRQIIVANYSSYGVSSTKEDIAFSADWHWLIYKRQKQALSKDVKYFYLQAAANEKKRYNHMIDYYFIKTIKKIYHIVNYFTLISRENSARRID